jgi:Nuclease-related domain
MEHMDLKGTLIFSIYTGLFIGLPVGVVWWDRRKRRTRKPFGENVRLLRMPGEYLFGRVIEHDVSAMQWTFGLMVVPILAGTVALQILPYFLGKTVPSLVIGLVVFVSAMALCIWRLVNRLKRRQDDYLGFFGERIVADCLEPLKEKGWFIFHDIQCVGETGKFNLDHVAVGPGGLWIVETKTRRKGRARAGREKGVVKFDGVKIFWPWWDDGKSVKQAVDNANWLQEWLQTLTGRKFEVSAVVAIPGYKIEEIGKGGIRVVEPEDLPKVLVGFGKMVLTAEDIKTVRLQLAAKCRDVEF